MENSNSERRIPVRHTLGDREQMRMLQGAGFFSDWLRNLATGSPNIVADVLDVIPAQGGTLAIAARITRWPGAKADCYSVTAEQASRIEPHQFSADNPESPLGAGLSSEKHDLLLNAEFFFQWLDTTAGSPVAVLKILDVIGHGGEPAAVLVQTMTKPGAEPACYAVTAEGVAEVHLFRPGRSGPVNAP